MYIGTMQEKNRCGKVARHVIDLACLPMDTALVLIQGASERQTNFAGDVRLHAITQMWEFLSDEYQTPKMASALIAVCNRQQSARFWLDNKDKEFIELFADEIEKEVEA